VVGSEPKKNGPTSGMATRCVRLGRGGGARHLPVFHLCHRVDLALACTIRHDRRTLTSVAEISVNFGCKSEFSQLCKVARTGENFRVEEVGASLLCPPVDNLRILVHSVIHDSG